MIDLKEKLQEFYYHYIYSPIYGFIENIGNLIYWIPKVWNDRDYDFESIYSLLYFKFKRMEKFYRDDKKTTSANHLETAYEIMIAKNLVKRLAEDDYLDNAMTNYNKKWKDAKLFDFIPDKYDKNGKPLLYRMEDRNEEQSKDFDKCCKLSDYLEKQDREYLFKHLTNNIRSWWD